MPSRCLVVERATTPVIPRGDDQASLPPLFSEALTRLLAALAALLGADAGLKFGCPQPPQHLLVLPPLVLMLCVHLLDLQLVRPHEVRLLLPHPLLHLHALLFRQGLLQRTPMGLLQLLQLGCLRME